MSSQFVSTWYVLDNSTVRLPVTAPATVSVNWGDSNTEGFSTTTDISHVYTDGTGVKTISVSGGGNTLTWDCCGAGATIGNLVAGQLRGVSECGGVLVLGNSGEQFDGCSTLTWSATDGALLTGVTTLERCFKNCSSLNTVPPAWKTSGVANFTDMFYGTSVFDGKQPVVTDLNAKSWLLSDASYVDQLIPNSDVSARALYTTRQLDTSHAVIQVGGRTLSVFAPSSAKQQAGQSSIYSVTYAESKITESI